MRRAAVQSAVLHTSSRVVGRGIPLAEVAVGFANVMHAKCIAPPVRAVGRRRRFLFSHAVTDPCIAVNVTNRNVVVARTTDDRAGNLHDRDCGESG
jgi:hypothetical protein